MSGYKFNPKDNCVRQESLCTFYGGYIPDDSPLKDSDCVSIEETTEDTYKSIDNIKEDINLSSLGQDCLSYNEVEAGKPTVLEVSKVFEEEICKLKDFNSKQVESICELPIEDCGLDLRTLVDSCNTVPETFSDILQVFIDEIQTLKSKVETLETYHT